MASIQTLGASAPPGSSGRFVAPHLPATEHASPMIRLDGVRKVYRTDQLETTALNDVNLEIRPREFVAVMGPSGCGKSTLLNVVAMIDTVTSGRYLLDDIEVSSFPESKLVDLRKQHIGFIFQSFNLIDDLSVYENVELPLLYQGASRQQRRTRVREVLELVDLLPRAKHKPSQLSGGQQQRVAVARALAMNPPVLLADEPTGNLDTRSADAIFELLRRFNREHGTSVLFVTHNPALAERCDKTIHVIDGMVVDEMVGGAVR